MATLHVGNVPDDLYEALRQRARANRNSISAEVVSLLEKNVPTAAGFKRRKKLLDRVLQVRDRKPTGPFPSSDEMLREDRRR